MEKVCVVGCGAISKVHIEAIKNCKNAVLYGLCDIDENKNEIAIDNSVKLYNDFEDVIKDNEIDAVHICTPHYLHFEMIKKSLKHGKKVVCEKPAVMTKEQFTELQNIKGIENVCFVMQNRLNRSVKELKKIIENKSLGKITGINTTLFWRRTKEYYNSGKWRGKWATEGGGVLINQAIHTLDLMSYLVGEIKSVKTNMTNFSLEDCIEVEDTCVSYIMFQNDLKGIFFATNANAENDDVEISVYFEKGTAKCVFGKLFVNGNELCENEKAIVGKNYWGNMHEKLISDYYENNKYFNVYEIENSMYAVFAMYESAKQNGKEIFVEK